MLPGDSTQSKVKYSTPKPYLVTPERGYCSWFGNTCNKATTEPWHTFAQPSLQIRCESISMLLGDATHVRIPQLSINQHQRQFYTTATTKYFARIIKKRRLRKIGLRATLLYALHSLLFRRRLEGPDNIQRGCRIYGQRQ